MNLIIEYIHSRWFSKYKGTNNPEFERKISSLWQKRHEKIDFETVLEIERKKTKREKRTIKITDFGAGSKKLGSIRSIQSIYKTNVASRNYQRFLFQLCTSFRCKNILEFGTSLGFSTIYLSKATQNGSVTTVEACPLIAQEATRLFRSQNLQNTVLINRTFLEFLDQPLAEKYDYIYIDGHHDGTALLYYSEALEQYMQPNCIVVLDDIRWSKGMKTAWEELTKMKQYSKHFDLFRMGILQFNPTILD